MIEKYNYIDCFCVSCNANLNKQSGFTIEDECWLCTECGVVNDVIDNNILNEIISVGECHGRNLACTYMKDKLEDK